MVVRQVQISSLFLQHRDRSTGQAVYLLIEERIRQIKRENLLCKFTQCSSSKTVAEVRTVSLNFQDRMFFDPSERKHAI